MGFYLTKIIAPLILPPGILVVLLAAGLILLYRNSLRWGKRLSLAGSAGLLLLSLPPVADALNSIIEPYPAIQPDKTKDLNAQAIVILSAGREINASEYGGDTLNSYSLERVRYGARLYHATGLPILVSGGNVLTKGPSLGALMAQSLHDDFAIEAKWIEDKSRNTAENAAFSHDILAQQHINKILLVTHAGHMPRSVAEFTHQGFEVIPAPTIFAGYDNAGANVIYFLPSATAFARSYFALHEMLGILWYKLRS